MDSNRRQPRQPSLAKLSGESPPKLHPDFQLMDTKQLIDTLPSYISLYSRSSLSSTPNSNPERSAILKWFSSLSVHHRLSYLTIVDHRFAQILLQMLSKLRLHGHGSFIILPDLPSSSSSSGNVLPSLCFRKSIGLLARVAESNASERLIRDSVRLFNSKEGENISDCSCAADCIDTVTFGEDFVEDADRFVWVMDGVSDSRFLCSDWSEMGGDWVELGWLKERGYYSMEAFVVNRVEVALRLAWLFCNNGKKRGVKLKLKERFRDVGVAANVYWRKKGCFDWWEKLDLAIKRKVLQTVLGKSAKSLTGEILRGADGPQGDEAWLFSKGAEWPLSYNHGVSSMRLGRDAEFGLTMSVGSCSTNPTSLANVINGLLVLQDIVGLILACDHGNFDEERLFFSSLDSVNTIWDCILRKLRGMLMVVSLDSTKLELLEDEEKKVLLNKAKEKVGGANHKKKGKNRNLKKPNPTSRSEVDFTPGKTLKDIEYCLDLRKKMDFTESNKMNVAVSEKDAESNLPYIIEGERVRGLVHQNVQAAARKSRKERRKKKSSGGKLDASHEFQRPPSQASKGEQSSQVINCSTVLDVNMPEDNSPGAENHEQRLNSTCNCVAASEEEGNLPNTGADEFLGSEEGSIRSHLKYCQSSDKTMKKEAILLKLEGANHAVDCDGIPSEMIEREAEHVANVKENCANSDIHSNKLEKAFLFPEPNDVKNEILPNHQAENRSVYNGQAPLLSGFPSYEWPSLTPFRFPSANSQHLPPATDRLHLEVGHNWYNHFQRSPMQQMHPFRNTEIEGGRGTILSQPLSVSLEYPPMVRNVNGLSSSITGKYDSGFISRRQYALQQGFPAQSAQFSAVTPEDERKIVDLSDLSNAPEIADEYDSHWVSEEEYELHTMSCIDYNQYFGGGIMYWNPSDYPGAGFSRPPSLSSDDSSWAWCEADMNRTVDDMVAFSSSYSTNGLASPSAAPFYSPFESLGPGHQALGYSRAGNEVTGKLLHTSSTTPDLGVQEDVAADSDAKSGDSLPYPMLRPIIIPNVSRERSRSDFKRSHDLRSPCVPPRRREKPTIKRPPSPVVLCVSHAPRPPPPSPVSDSRKQRGFPTVRSGSSSPRHWGMRGWFHDGNNFDEACVRMDGAEMVWPSWGNKKYSSHQLVQPLPGALLQDRLIAISQLTHDQDHPDVNLPLQPLELPNSPAQEASLSLMHSLLHEEIDCFCKQVAAQNLIRRPYINWAVKRVTRSLQVLWPRSRTNIFGSNATGLSLPTSDVDLVVCLPPVRNLEPIKEAGILEGRNGIKETCLQHAARYLANQEWVQADSLKTVENTTIPIIMLVVEVPDDLICSTASSTLTPNEPSQLTGEEGVCQTSMGGPDNFPLKQSDINDDGKDAKSVRLDISFKSSSHTGLQTTELVKQLTEQFPASVPLALVLKQFLADRSLDQSYSGGLSSYCLVLLIIRFLQHEHHHGRPITQNLGSLFMDFLYFFGNVFDPRQMCVAIQGSGLYINRERGYSIDPIYIDDPLFPTNNVGKNCFRIHQCIKAFADAYSTLANELACFTNDADVNTRPQHQLLQKIIPSIGLS